ncbi:acetyl/propionyl/methylcrotonyl-CoA carboxylase subunit alpha [Actinomycetospora termitidis]|uniref:Biotin carboxylase N-terminal domain-containing protein n=1 Tax=Actinomycetospora termitidis TaxID=3053470 RepID=A0ABT7M9Q1_9PSEU|nr:biotin carboxylase N-terminal domain-containing protein [Actinomycetospora sp. Odt1-22]MDL5157403.1 biotin carboxylase N-terminal domain-containing protein [Actinomycetospora sp. Odt1-22]
MRGAVLVANRGEVAVRVLRACRVLGVRGVAVYSDADARAAHVRASDVAVRIGPAPARESYLDGARLVGVAREQGVAWVHPGYGLLSEDARFASAVLDAGLGWVGPPPEVIAQLGDKVAARAAAREVGVPVLDGTDAPVDATTPGLADLAAAIGFPVLVKAAHGGGGRGMRVVRRPAELDDALAAAGREAAASAGRSEVFLERLVEHARHVEVQVLADDHGAVAVLGDRDCTVQRRHQKLLEEAPAPDLPDALRAAMHDDARRLVRSVGYRGAGTVEFLLDPAAGRTVFLEMNTRLQVEHGVTEMVTGVDLVAAQLRIAAGEPLAGVLGLDGDVPVRGHAVEARITAEDPAADFRPSPGHLTALTLPSGPFVRCDVGYAAGDDVPSAYDSLLGKVHAWAPDRDTARARLAAALDELVVDGVPTTGPLLREVLDRPAFAAVSHDTGSLERDWLPTTAAVQSTPPVVGTGPDDGSRTVELDTDAGPLRLRVPGRAGTGTARPTRTRTGRAVTADDTTGGGLTAPMDATVVAVPARCGVRVEVGEVLVVLEAMKMELPVRATSAGEVAAVHVTAGDGVTAGTVLVAVTG